MATVESPEIILSPKELEPPRTLQQCRGRCRTAFCQTDTSTAARVSIETKVRDLVVQLIALPQRFPTTWAPEPALGSRFPTSLTKPKSLLFGGSKMDANVWVGNLSDDPDENSPHIAVDQQKTFFFTSFNSTVVARRMPAHPCRSSG